LYWKLTIFGEGSRREKVAEPGAGKTQASRPGPNRKEQEGGLAKKMTRKRLKKFG
jgi:hypothetical protein